MVIQQGWNVIRKALQGAENSMNKTFQGEQPTLSVPPHYFTYLQPQRAKLPPPHRLHAVVEAGAVPTPSICCFHFSEVWMDGWAGVGWGDGGENDGGL